MHLANKISIVALTLASVVSPAIAKEIHNIEENDLDRNGERILVIRQATVSPKRAEELSQFILNNYGKPDYILSPGNWRYTSSTVAPLSKATGVHIDSTNADYRSLGRKLVNNKNYCGKLIVLEWPYKNIGQLSTALKARRGYAPAGWSPKAYSQVLQFDYRGYDNTADVMAFSNPF